MFTRLARTIASAAALAMLAACTSAPPATTARPEKPSVTMRRAWQATVEVDQSDSTVTTLPSGDREQHATTRHATFTLRVDPSARTTARLDHLAIEPSPASVPLGATWTANWPSTAARVTPHTRDAATATLTAMVRDLLPQLPDGGVEPGMHWSDSTTARVVQASGLTATERRSTAWTSDQFTMWGGRETLPIVGRGDYERIGSGRVDNAAASLTSQGRSICKYYLTIDGRIDAAVCDDSLGTMISIPSQRRLIPTMRHVTTTFRFVADN